jgi:peptidyl-Lys metalloendopeptidase
MFIIPRKWKIIAWLALAIAISLPLLAVTPVNLSKYLQEQPVLLEAKLQVNETISSGKPVIVNYSLKNGTEDDLYVLKWYTPFEGIAGEIFLVEMNGEPVQYQGILAKRAAPNEDEYILLKPGESTQTEVDISQSYNLNKPGNYAIQYLSPSVSDVATSEKRLAKSQKDLGPIEISSSPVELEILGPEASSKIDTSNQLEAKAPVYANCSDSQENIISSSDAAATLSTAFAYSHLNNLTADQRKTDADYKTWYGAYDDGRYTKVLNNWNTINNTFTNQAVTYNCSQASCQNSWYAYVYPGGALEVFLCPQFWNAPDTGTDTKFGTIIHEVSHEVAGTKDHAYGVSNCKNLASNDPVKAVENADCYEYFAESHKITIGPENLILPLMLVCILVFVEGYRRYRRMRMPS